MKRGSFTASLLFSLALVACNQTEAPSRSADSAPAAETPAAASSKASAHEMTPEQLGELGAQIEKSKDRAPQILSEHGLDEKSFEAQIRKVTENPEASKRYAAAYQKAKA